MNRRARSYAVGVQWASQIINVAMMMALVPLGGYWLDQKWGTEPWLVIFGGLLGFYTGFSHLMRLLKRAEEKQSRQAERERSAAERSATNEDAVSASRQAAAGREADRGQTPT